MYIHNAYTCVLHQPQKSTAPRFAPSHAPRPRIDAPPPPSSGSSNMITHTYIHTRSNINIASCWTAFRYSYVASPARSFLYLIPILSQKKSTRLLGRSSSSNRATSAEQRAFTEAPKKRLPRQMTNRLHSSIGFPEIK